MKHTLTTAPVLALVALSLGVGASPASAGELPVPVPTTLLQDTAAALLPVPLPTVSPSPLLPAPLPAPAPVPTATPSVASAPTPTSRTASAPLGSAVHSEAQARPVAAPVTAANDPSLLTGATSGLRFSSATTPAWASYLTRTPTPTVAAAPAPVTLLTTRAGAVPAAPGGVPGAATTLALALLALTGAGHLVARRRGLTSR